MNPALIGRSSPREPRVLDDQIHRYMRGGQDFIDDALIEDRLAEARSGDPRLIRDIIAKALDIETLSPNETAALINVEDPGLWEEMREAAGAIKRKVYDNRIVTFAPLYLSNLCVNNCLYCGLRRENGSIRRRTLSLEEIRREVEILAGEIGHKRLVVVYGEHPVSGVDYMIESIEAIYGVKVKTKNGTGQIRRVNVNAAPLPVEDLERLGRAGLGTFQVFQETYHHRTYAEVHPAGTIKSNYPWRLYAMHRAMEAGVDDVGIGALFGLYDWRFEVMGLLHHAIELEEAFGIGPHTISFPRLEPAQTTPFVEGARWRVDDEDFKKAITVLRLAVPYAGMILTARESARIRREVIPLGITQTDASSRIGIGAYNDGKEEDQQTDSEQFLLGDTRSLDSVINELAGMGCITSFCTAGYRCGRTGKSIMDLLRSGKEGKFCKLNAVLTFREWLDDFASPATREAGEKLIAREVEEIQAQMPRVFDGFMNYYQRTGQGERDLYF